MFTLPFKSDKNFQDFLKTSWGKNFSILKLEQLENITQSQLLNEVLHNNTLNYPQIRIMTNQETVNPLLYTESNRRQLSTVIDKEKVLAQITELNTIKIEDIDNLHAEINNISKDVAKFFNCDITMNCYMSHGPSLGIPGHYDSYHIFAVQLDGKKDWELGDIVVKNPYKDFHIKKVEPPKEPIKISTYPGDILYIPPGLWHATFTEDSSTHIAIGVHTERYFQKFCSSVMDLASSISEIRNDIPFKLTESGLKNHPIEHDELDKILQILKHQIMNNYK